MLSLLRDMMMNPVSLGWIVARLPAQIGDELRWVQDALGGKLSLGGPMELCAHDILRGEAVVAANRCQGNLRGGLVRAVNIFRGSAQAGSLKACNLFLGSIRGGTVEATNLIVGDLLEGRVRDVNVMVGSVRGGSAHSLNAMIGDVHGGSVTGVHVLVGNVHGGVVEAAVLVGEGGEVRADVHLGRRSAKLASRKRARMSRMSAPPAARDAGKSSREWDADGGRTTPSSGPA